MMSWLQRLVEGLTKNSLSSVRAWGKQQLVKIILIVFCGMATLAGLGFVAVGGYISLSNFFSPWQSGLIVGGIIMLLSFISALLLWLSIKSTAPHQAPPPEVVPTTEQPELDDVAYLGELIGARLSQRGIRTMDVMIAALVAGTIIGISPALRHRRRKSKRDSIR